MSRWAAAVLGLILGFGIAPLVLSQTSVRVNSLRINNGKATTENRDVRLYNRVSGIATHYRTGSSPNLSAAPWRTYSSVTKFTLSAGEGRKKLYFQVRSLGRRGQALSNVASDTITLVVPLKIGVAINDGAETTTVREIHLQVKHYGGGPPTEFRRGESKEGWASNCKDEGWLAFEPASQFVLSPTPGQKIVYSQARTSDKCSRIALDEIIYQPE